MAKAPKKHSMSGLFVVAPSLTLPPPADASGGNEATDEDDDEALCAVVRQTKQMKRKHKLDETLEVTAVAAVGRPESEWNFIREFESVISILSRGYAVSMRGGTTVEGRRLFDVEDLPPMDTARLFITDTRYG
ncbi:hypothetical protein GUJ93_ZPchr0001g32944 [Zizania palustris]|uniref:Uncharacterized protein n=1 Tax=Zizania palustris TaxID=103762 RepID=A0A8J5RT51_ZIZPA|nr:hypothetical protein GUJ93_ZPchr0001g32944 [Zizania palustris]